MSVKNHLAGGVKIAVPAWQFRGHFKTWGIVYCTPIGGQAKSTKHVNFMYIQRIFTANTLAASQP